MAKWRADYETSLKAPNGWLSVAGLFWLRDGVNVVGSDPQSDVITPAGTPKRAGVLRFAGGKVAFEPQAGAGIAAKGELKPDISGHPDVFRIGAVSLTVIVRGPKTGVRMRDPNAETSAQFHRQSSGIRPIPLGASKRSGSLIRSRKKSPSRTSSA